MDAWRLQVMRSAQERARQKLGSKPGLGDRVASALAAVGITKERVSKALGVKDCGCKRRAEALNRIGRKFGIG